ncbi:NrdH-redoxin, partial [Candidatus Woesearchaeota archaeon CG_4_10_14_0_8_um_filter_47_5]
PHCSREKAFLAELGKEVPGLTVALYEGVEHEALWRSMCAQYGGVSCGPVPLTFIGDKAFIGFSEEEGPLEKHPVYNAYVGYSNQLIIALEEELGTSITNPLHRSSSQVVLFLGIVLALYLASYPLLGKRLGKKVWIGILAGIIIVSFFILIAVTPERTIKDFAEKLPFPGFVFVVALADGFNPCAFTVLIILLSLLTHTKSRKKMVLVGSIFIAASAVMYFVFIMAMIIVGSFFFSRYGVFIMRILGAG